VSAEVPKLQHRLLLADPDAFGDRPPAEVIVVLPDPAVIRRLRFFAAEPAPPRRDDRAMAFKPWHRFEYV
jgi:hypothetical protein